MYSNQKLQIDFQLLYLAEITRQKVKPLSRWEKPLDSEIHRWLRRQGFKVDTIPRKTLLRRKIYETIFSTSSHYLDFYHRKFYNTCLNKKAEVQRLEGFLFGYPACCVDQFIRQPYIANGFKREEQELLFHWACPNCFSSRELLPYYRAINRDVRERYQQEFSNLSIEIEQRAHLSHKKMAFAAAMVCLLSSGVLFGKAPSDSTHFIPVAGDMDSDGLTYAEEFYLGNDFQNPVTGLSNKTDGEFWSLYFKAIIDTLPTSPQPDRPYKIEYPAWGLETCQKCGEEVNMGFVRIVNPLRNLESDIPYIGLHYLEKGCFSYLGNIHEGRVVIDSLKKMLFPYDPAHLLPVAGDSDNDGLTDAEEDSLYLNPLNPDTDGDGVPDGARVAEQLIRLFPELSEQTDGIHTKIGFVYANGLENCQICGSLFNMGGVGFTNPENGRTFFIHFNGMHTLAHGSFAYHGTAAPNQRADAVDMYRTMKTHTLFIANDSDKDGLSDEEELQLGYDPLLKDSDGDGVSDGMDLAMTLSGILDNLPTQPVTTGPYVLHHPTFGFWNCLLCGEAINMGFMEVFNPALGNDPLTISYYAYHFLKKGSFSHEGRIDNGQWIEGRIDPLLLAQYLDYEVNIDNNDREGLIKGIMLYQNYPNPFNPSTNLGFGISDLLNWRFLTSPVEKWQPWLAKSYRRGNMRFGGMAGMTPDVKLAAVCIFTG
jgi:hypothetical protein